MSSAVVRTAGFEDAGKIALLHANSWRRHYRAAYADSFLDGDLDADRQAVWSARLGAPANSRTIIAEINGESVGFIHVVFDEDQRWGSLIDNLHVAYAHQRASIGSALLAHAAGLVVEKPGGNEMYLWVLEQNTAAQGFYLARGATHVETVTVGAPGGNPANLNGSPRKMRMAWPEAGSVATGGRS